MTLYGRNDSGCWGGLRTGKANVLDYNDASQKDGQNTVRRLSSISWRSRLGALVSLNKQHRFGG